MAGRSTTAGRGYMEYSPNNNNYASMMMDLEHTSAIGAGSLRNSSQTTTYSNRMHHVIP